MELTDKQLKQVFEENPLLGDYLQMNLEQFIEFYRKEKERQRRYLIREAESAGYEGNISNLTENLKAPPELFKLYEEAKASGSKLSFEEFRRLMEK